jgi:acyl carrier protein
LRALPRTTSNEYFVSHVLEKRYGFNSILVVFMDQEKMDQEKIENWLVNRIAILLGVDSEEVDLEKSVFTYGLDSSVVLTITGELEVLLDLELEATLFWEYPKVSELIKYLVNQLAVK